MSKKEDQNNVDTGNYLDNSYRYRRANALIGSKYKSTLMSNRLMALCLSRVSNMVEADEGALVLTIPGNEIQKIFGSTSHSFFSDLDTTANSMTGRSIGWSNPETNEFEYTAVVTHAKYSNGMFSIEFNRHMRDYLKSIDTPYTWLQLPVMLSFQSVYTFRLYEVLKSKSYTPKGVSNPDNKYKFQIDLDELRLMLGVVNAELASVKSVLNKTKGKPDYKKAVEASPEKVYSEWKEFRRNCIEVAVKEINKTPGAEMHVEWEPLKSGRGGRVYALMFFVDIIKEDAEVVEPLEVKNKPIELSEDDKLDIMVELKVIFNEYELKSKDLRSIAEAANWDVDVVREKAAIAETQDISNIVGWMIKAIKDDYSEAQSSSPKGKDKKKSSSFNNFDERTYDYDEFVKDILQ